MILTMTTALQIDKSIKEELIVIKEYLEQ